MIGQACPSDRTSRSAAGWFGCVGSYRMCVYISTVTRCARLAADVGWPEPAAVVMSSDNLIRSMALACTEATKAIFYSSSLTRVRVQSLRRLARTHDQPPGQVKLIGVHCHRFGLNQGDGTGGRTP